MTKLGYQIPNYTHPSVAATDLFGAVAASAQAAESAGADTVFVMDHFYQLPGIGPPDHAMLEAYTTLSALAPVTEKVRLGTLVTGNTYRKPTQLAKEVTTLDIISGGRPQYGLGAGCYQLDHYSLG